MRGRQAQRFDDLLLCLGRCFLCRYDRLRKFVNIARKRTRNRKYDEQASETDNKSASAISTKQ